MNTIFKEFKRIFSVSMYKDYKIDLARMSFFKDFINDKCGDLYPIKEKSAECAESVASGEYRVSGGSISRLFCRFFPYATYELTADVSGGAVGFEFLLPSASKKITADSESVYCDDKKLTHGIGSEITLTVSCRPGAFDVFFKTDGFPRHFCTFTDADFKNSNLESEFSDGYVYLLADGAVTVKQVSSYIDCGVSIADMRPIKYENGEIIYENGKIYFTASSRMQEGACQAVFSWVPGTAQFELCGFLFFDVGDGRWSPYVASSVLYDRQKKEWYIWTSSFECGHILCFGHFTGDPRFGINVVDVTMMEKAPDGTDITEFAGFFRDEDPDFYYDEELKKWRFAVCRINPETEQYSYVFFESDEPFSGYRHIGTSVDGAETGGSFVSIEGERFFVCGNDFKKTSDYRIYSKDGMTTAKFNYPDGGFRGWGSIIPVKMCGRMRYFWMTFDRHKGSGYNWSYGNIYIFEAK